MVLGLTAPAEALLFEAGLVIRKGGEKVGMSHTATMQTSLPETQFLLL